MHFPISYQRISKTTNTTANDIDDTWIAPRDSNNNILSLDIDYIDTWKAMEDLLKTGKVRSLGVSNFNSQQLDRLISSATIKPVANQVECHPNLNQLKLIEFSKARNVTIIGYSPLGKPGRNTDKKIAINSATVQEIAEKYKKTPAQIVLRYSHQNGVVVIPKSTHVERLRGNIDLFDFSLNDDDISVLNSLNDNTRLVSFADNKSNKYYPFNAEF